MDTNGTYHLKWKMCANKFGIMVHSLFIYLHPSSFVKEIKLVTEENSPYFLFIDTFSVTYKMYNLLYLEFSALKVLERHKKSS
jgi:hypothetical protein